MSSVPVGDTVLQQDPHNINSRLKKKKTKNSSLTVMQHELLSYVCIFLVLN